MKMKTSYFGFIKDLDAIEAAGYDCGELHIKEIMALDDAGYEKAVAKVRASSLTCEVFDNPLPLDAVVADPAFDLGYYRDYLARAVERTAKLGARYFVYGNGRTRSLPEGDGRAAAADKNARLLRMLCGLAAKENITILLEPLALTVSNVFLGIDEAYTEAQRLGIPNLKTLLDFRWFVDREHPFEMISRYADFVQHVHIDNPLSPFPNRRVSSLEDGYDYAPLFDTLKKICYKGIISIEANTTDDFAGDLKKGLELFANFGIEPYRA